MPKTILTTLIALLALGAGGALKAAPLLAVDQLEFNFGYAPQNSKVCRNFQLRNDGDDTLKITKVIPGCGCTQMPLMDSSLAPGETTLLQIIFSTGHYNGVVTKRPRIETNESVTTKNLTIQTNVTLRPDSTYPLLVKPYKLDISQFGTTVRDQMKFTVTNVSEVALRLTAVSVPSELMLVELPDQVAAGRSVTGLVKLNPAALNKDLESSFTIETGDEARTRFTVPVKRTVKSPAQASTATGTKTK